LPPAERKIYADFSADNKLLHENVFYNFYKFLLMRISIATVKNIPQDAFLKLPQQMTKGNLKMTSGIRRGLCREVFSAAV